MNTFSGLLPPPPPSQWKPGPEELAVDRDRIALEQRRLELELQSWVAKPGHKRKAEPVSEEECLAREASKPFYGMVSVSGQAWAQKPDDAPEDQRAVYRRVLERATALRKRDRKAMVSIHTLKNFPRVQIVYTRNHQLLGDLLKNFWNTRNLHEDGETITQADAGQQQPADNAPAAPEPGNGSESPDTAAAVATQQQPAGDAPTALAPGEGGEASDTPPAPLPAAAQLAPLKPGLSFPTPDDDCLSS